MSTEPGIKFDDGKADWTLLPFAPLREVVGVLMGGVKKYSRDNWQQVPDGHDRYIKGAFRHLIAYTEGEKIDPDFGLSHLAHAICCLLFALWFDLTGKKEAKPESMSHRFRWVHAIDLMRSAILSCKTEEALYELSTTLAGTGPKMIHGYVLGHGEKETFHALIKARQKEMIHGKAPRRKR